MTLYIGFDVHSKQTTYAIMNEAGELKGQGSIATSASSIQDFLITCNIPEGTKIGLETGAQAMWLSRLLASLEMKPIVINAHEVRAKARRKNQKCDKRDAYEICDGIRKDIYDSIVYVPSAQILALRELLSRRAHFVGLRTSEANAAKFLLRSQGKTTTGIKFRNKDGWDKAFALMADPQMEELMQMHKDAWALAERYVKALDGMLEKAMTPFAEANQLLQTIPGIGPICSSAFVAAISEPERFESSSHVASYLGMVPSTFDSGGKERHGHITKRGPAYVRSVMCEAAQTAARTASPFNAYWKRRCARGGYRKAVIATAHQMVRVMYQVWKNKTPFDAGRLGAAGKRTCASSLMSKVTASTTKSATKHKSQCHQNVAEMKASKIKTPQIKVSKRLSA